MALREPYSAEWQEDGDLRLALLERHGDAQPEVGDAESRAAASIFAVPLALLMTSARICL